MESPKRIEDDPEKMKELLKRLEILKKKIRRIGKNKNKFDK